ncbi:MAG TPA: hypothetical protein VJ960_06925, partial [Oceanipulchritudo sp.]|nr:hypothetical protein [Oceanipulchritudo sp.]
MGRFRYEAIDREGRTRKGVLEAESVAEANQMVFSMEMNTLQLSRDSGRRIDFSPAAMAMRFKHLKAEEL